MTTSGLGSQSAVDVAQHDGRRWLMLTVLLIGQFMGLVDVLIVNVAMPAIGADLHASGAALQLVVGGYTVAYAMLLITGARLGDLYGRRRMYLLGAIGFTVASAACGFAPTAVTLIVLRFLQGASAAVMVPQIISVIQMRFTGAARAKALSAYSVVLSTGAVVGLVLGGVIVSANLAGAGWRPVFLVNVPLGVLLTILVPLVMPADVPSHTRRLDLAGLAIALPAVFLIVLPLVLGHELGWPVWTFVSIAVGVLLAALFVPVERRIGQRGGDPLVNLAVLRSPGMGTGLTTLTCMQVTYGALLFIFTLHLEAGLRQSALRAGLTYLPMSGTFGLVGFYWRKLPARVHPFLAPTGLALCAVSYLALALATRHGGDGPLMWAALTADGIGMGLSAGPLLTQSLVHVPRALAPDASGLVTTTVQLGQVSGIAVFGTVFLSLRQSLAPTLVTPRASGLALAGTCWWMVALAAVGVVAGIALSRTVRRAGRPPLVPQVSEREREVRVRATV